MRYNSFKSRFLLYNQSFVVLTIAVSCLAIYFMYRNNKQSDLRRGFDLVALKIEQGVSTGNYFLLNETDKSMFYEEPHITLLEERLGYITEARIMLEQLKEQSALNEMKVEGQIEELYTELMDYDSLFNEALEQIKQRGFKDYGEIGLLRTHIHTIEDQKLLPLSTILMLRRHEKDYLLRHESQYARLLNDEISKLEGVANPVTRKLLQDYRESFNKVVDYDFNIGLKSNTGIAMAMDEKLKTIHAETEMLQQKVDAQMQKAFKDLIWIFLSILAVTVLIAIVLSERSSNAISEPLDELKESLDMVQFRGYQVKAPMLPENNADEIGVVVTKFERFLQRLQQHLNILKQGNDDISKPNGEEPELTLK